MDDREPILHEPSPDPYPWEEQGWKMPREIEPDVEDEGSDDDGN